MAPYILPPNAVWFITGCSSGIGLALATHLSTHTPSRIVATARNLSSLTHLTPSPNLLKLSLDVTSESSIQAALAATVDTYGRIDILVNNAGFNILAEAETVPLSAAQSIMDTNFWGPVHLTQRALPILREQNSSTGQTGGVVVQMSSVGGRLAFAGNSFYHASKFALEGFTEAIAKEMMDGWNIHFCCIEPGGVKTRYAETSVASTVAATATLHPAYSDPKSPTNMLRRYHEDPAAMRFWAEAGDVAEAVYRVVSSGEIPLRMPLGADSWGLQRRGVEVWGERLDQVREVAVGVSREGERQVESVRFLEL
jgi:NAD(P)-dependent dehydrogenase (short-subunit alcohol dehydrogenase family)